MANFCLAKLAVPLLLLAATLAGVPAFAEVDLSGEWAVRFYEDQPDRGPGPEIGDYLGLPINAAARARAHAWEASMWTLPEWQCRPHGADYMWRSLSEFKIWKEDVPSTRATKAYHFEWLRSIDNPVYMDGRPHPPEYAAHTWGGFATGKWEGDTLTVTITHLKESYIRRNGVPRSDLATVTEHLIRHGNWLTVTVITYDPVYLTEPFIQSSDFELDLHQRVEPYLCEVTDEVERPKGAIPHKLPGTNQDIKEFSFHYGIPEDVAKGGAETMYPEYRKKLKGMVAKYRPGQLKEDRVRRLAITALLASGLACAQQNQNAANAEVHTLKVRGDIYMLVGAGGNITVSVTNAGVVLVDAGLAQMSGKVIAAIKQITDQPVRYIINTHVHPDHIGGNEQIAAAGSTLAGGNFAGTLEDASMGAAIFAHESVLNRMSAPPAAGQAAIPFRAWPTDTYHSGEMRLSGLFHGEPIRIIHQPSAHTDGDSIVVFTRTDVISTGDLFTTTGYPFVDLQRGGNIQGIIDGLNRLLDLALPDFRSEGGTMIIPGHGRLCDMADVAYYRDMVTIVRDRIKDMIKKDMTLEQIKAAQPTLDYDPRYGNPDRFIEGVYRSLNRGK